MREITIPLDLYGLGWTSSFVFVSASLLSLVVGVLAGMSRLLTDTVLALLVSVGATLLVVALGA